MVAKHKNPNILKDFLKDFDPNNIKIDEKSYKNILIYEVYWISDA